MNQAKEREKDEERIFSSSFPRRAREAFMVSHLTFPLFAPRTKREEKREMGSGMPKQTFFSYFFPTLGRLTFGPIPN